MILGCLKRLHKTKYVTWFHIFIAFIFAVVILVLGLTYLTNKRLEFTWMNNCQEPIIVRSITNSNHR